MKKKLPQWPHNFYETLSMYHGLLSRGLDDFESYNSNGLNKEKAPLYMHLCELLEKQPVLSHQMMSLPFKDKKELDALEYVLQGSSEHLDMFSDRQNLIAFQLSGLLLRDEDLFTYEDLASLMIEKGYNPWEGYQENDLPRSIQYIVMRDSLRLLQESMGLESAPELDVEKFLTSHHFSYDKLTFWEVMQKNDGEGRVGYSQLPRFFINQGYLPPFLNDKTEKMEAFIKSSLPFIKVLHETGHFPSDQPFKSAYRKKLLQLTKENQLTWNQCFSKMGLCALPRAEKSDEVWMDYAYHESLNYFANLADMNELWAERRKMKIQNLRQYGEGEEKWNLVSDLMIFALKCKITKETHAHKKLARSGYNFAYKKLKEALNDGVVLKDCLDWTIKDKYTVRDLVILWYLCQDKNRSVEKKDTTDLMLPFEPDSPLSVLNGSNKILDLFEIDTQEFKNIIKNRLSHIISLANELKVFSVEKNDFEMPRRNLKNTLFEIIHSDLIGSLIEEDRVKFALNLISNKNTYILNSLYKEEGKKVHDYLLNMKFEDKEKEASFKTIMILHRSNNMDGCYKSEEQKEGLLLVDYYKKVQNVDFIKKMVERYISVHDSRNDTSDIRYMALREVELNKTLISLPKNSGSTLKISRF